MSNLKIVELSDKQLIKEILKCELEIKKIISHPSILMLDEYYPGELMGLGDTYCERFLLMDELFRRKNARERKDH